MNKFRILKNAGSSSNCCARAGSLRIGKEFNIDTPNFISPTSRGSIPHLTPDVLQEHTDVRGVHVALEDFVEKIPRGTPPVYEYPGPLRDFFSLPQDKFLILAPRRCPAVDAPPKNSDSQITVLTSVGFRELSIVDYVSAAKKLKPDIVLSIADIPNVLPPGRNRLPRMLFRSELWLGELLNRFEKPEDRGDMDVFAPVLPLTAEIQSSYLKYLESVADKLSGLAVYDASVAPLMAQKLRDLPLLSVDIMDGPHGLLREIEWGVDICNVGFVVAATDAGVALNFSFEDTHESTAETPAEAAAMAAGTGISDGEPLGIDMWKEVHKIDTKPAVEGCSCYTCKTYHRAYLHHCLSAKEMTAWVLLQIHNMHIIDKFFENVRKSIHDGTFEQAKAAFERKYRSEMPEKSGVGPRLRGYQFKTVGFDEKKNTRQFRKLQDETNPQIETPPTDAENLVVNLT